MTQAACQADRFARARQEFVDAVAAGCSILDLRRRREDMRIALRQRAREEVADHTADLMTSPPSAQEFSAWSCPHMMRD
jgi:hypothetical protein